MEEERDAARSSQNPLWVIYLIVFLGFIGISIPYLLFPALFLHPEYSFVPAESSPSHRSFLLGIALAVYPLGQFIGSPILGTLSDAFGRKKLLATSLCIAALMNALTGLAIAKEVLPLLILSRFIVGLMEGNIAIARAMGADIPSIPKQKTIGRINAFVSIGYLIGPLIGALLADKSLGLTTATPFFAVGFLLFCLSLLSAFLLPKATHSNAFALRGILQRMNFLRSISLLFADSKLKLLFLTSTLFTLAADMFYEFGPVYLTMKWTLQPSQLIVYNGALCLGLALGNGWLPSFVSSRLPHPSSLFAAMMGFSLLLFGVVFTDSHLLMTLLFATCGIAIGLAITMLTVKISDTASDDSQGEALGVQHSLRVLGDAAICLLGGAVLAISSKAILLTATLLPSMALLLYKKGFKKLKI